MNQGRIWCVVHPTVGLPLLLGSVATIALIVHASVLTHTTWFGSYWQGGTKAKTASNETSTSVAALSSKSSGFSITVKPVAASDGRTDTAFVVTVGADNGKAPMVASTGAPIPRVSPTADHLALAQPPTR